MRHLAAQKDLKIQNINNGRTKSALGPQQQHRPSWCGLTETVYTAELIAGSTATSALHSKSLQGLFVPERFSAGLTIQAALHR